MPRIKSSVASRKSRKRYLDAAKGYRGGRSRLIRTLAEAYYLLARIWPSMFAYQYILEAEITTLDEESTELPQPRATHAAG